MDAATSQQLVTTLVLAVYVLTGAMVVLNFFAALTLWQTRKTHHLVNSQWTEWKAEFLRQKTADVATGRAEGVREGRDQRQVHHRDPDGTR
jgi:hypothetical protein